MAFNRQKEIKAELIAHLVVAGIERPQIAHKLGLTHHGLDAILRDPDYQAIEERVANALKGKMQTLSDERLKKRMALKEEVEDAVAEAIKLLLQKLRKDKDLRAALEILDRDPQHDFAKASRQAQTDGRLKAPAISSEALSSAIKEADVTQKIMRAAEQLGSEKRFPEA